MIRCKAYLSVLDIECDISSKCKFEEIVLGIWKNEFCRNDVIAISLVVVLHS